AAAAMKETSIRGDFREQRSGSRRAGLVLAFRSEWLFETGSSHSATESKWHHPTQKSRSAFD
ncbi:MAG: hypothetical protein WCY91_10800, partial [Acidithiobacillus sp.]